MKYKQTSKPPIKRIDRSPNFNDKMIGCTAIIISGVAYKNIKF